MVLPSTATLDGRLGPMVETTQRANTSRNCSSEDLATVRVMVVACPNESQRLFADGPIIQPSVAGRSSRFDDRAIRGTSGSEGNGTRGRPRESSEGRLSGGRRRIGERSVKSSVTEHQEILDSKVMLDVKHRGDTLQSSWGRCVRSAYGPAITACRGGKRPAARNRTRSR